MGNQNDVAIRIEMADNPQRYIAPTGEMRVRGSKNRNFYCWANFPTWESQRPELRRDVTTVIKGLPVSDCGIEGTVAVRAPTPATWLKRWHRRHKQVPRGYPKGISGGCATLGLALQSRLEGLSFYVTHHWQLDQAEEAFVAACCQGPPVFLSREER